MGNIKRNYQKTGGDMSRKFVISEELLSAALQYLNTRPRAEVNNLCNAIEANITELEQYKAQEIAEKAETEKRNTELKEVTRKKIIDEYEAEKRNELINEFNELGLVGSAEELDNDTIKEMIKCYKAGKEREAIEEARRKVEE